MPDEVTRMIASVGCSISGSGTVSTRTSWTPCQVTAFMVLAWFGCPPRLPGPSAPETVWRQAGPETSRAPDERLHHSAFPAARIRARARVLGVGLPSGPRRGGHDRADRGRADAAGREPAPSIRSWWWTTPPTAPADIAARRGRRGPRPVGPAAPSTARCAARATRCGARCRCAHGDVVCFLDADSEDFGAHFACGLRRSAGLRATGTDFVKGFYRRPVPRGRRHAPTTAAAA